jgi:hypothetical protein
MSKYTPTFVPRSRSIVRFREAHPVWRGIGCFLLILVPVLSFAGAKLLVQANFKQRWIDIPRELMGSFLVPVVGRVYFADLAVTIILIVIGFGILTVVYALIYRMFGPPRHGPLDSPPG